MAEIRPFRGIRYNLEKLGGDARKLVSPPYDVIDEKMQQDLYDAHPNNVVRIIQGKEEAGDSATEHKYTRAADCFKGWQASGDFVKDDAPTIYVYAQDFQAQTLFYP